MTIKDAVKIMIPSIITIAGALGIIYLKATPVQALAPVMRETHSAEFQHAFFEAARVYGKAGCGDQLLAEMTARHSISSGLPSSLIAAQVATESMCNSLAVSNKGAIGLTQVVPKQWSGRFDFSKVNLLNPDENMTVGTTILSGLVKQYGLRNGLARYYGTGPDTVGLGGGYTDKILQLTGKL